LVNGRIHTTDPRDSVVSSVAIPDGRFAAPDSKLNACAATINLHGRTAAPGLVGNHNHIVLLGIRPGYDARLEDLYPDGYGDRKAPI
jgi:predicted amidohydrolase YtcJ